jgi:Spy/CpxP family protein refolding chaperone
MKKIISTLLVASISLFANHNKADELIKLPYPVKTVVTNIGVLKINDKQKTDIDVRMLNVYPEKIQSKMQRVSKLEKEIQNAVLMKNKNKDELKIKIDKVAEIKREVTDIHIDALNVLSSILTAEQFDKTLKIMKKQNQAKKTNSKFKIDELAILPHPGKMIKMGKISITAKQKERFIKEIKAVYPPIFQSKIREAFKLEKKLQRAIVKGKTKDEVKGLLDNIAKLKREAMDSRIDALNHLKEIMTPSQWKKLNKLAYK